MSELEGQEPQEQQNEQQDTQRQSDETRARSMGWRPKEEFRGDETKWVDATEFVRRGEEHLPIVRAELKRTRQDLDETRRLAREALEFQRQNNERERKRLQGEIEGLKQQQLAAVQSGDTQAYLQTEQAIKNKTEQMPAEIKPQPAPPVPPEVADFKRRNPWFERDPALRGAANGIHEELLANEPELSLAENIQRVEEEVKRRFPDRFVNPRRNSPGTVEGVTQTGGRPSGAKKKGYADLPAEAKAACDKYVAQKLMTREQYLADYQFD